MTHLPMAIQTLLEIAFFGVVCLVNGERIRSFTPFKRDPIKIFLKRRTKR
jgi:hypothetical protein